MMQWLLVAGYSALFLWTIRRWKFLQPSGIPLRWLQAAFLLKVAAGCFVGWLYYEYYHDATTGDTIKFFNDGNLLFETLHHNPQHFLKMLTGIGGKSPELLPYYEKMSAWLNTDVLFNDNKTIIRANAFFRFFSLGHYYVHVVFINMFSFCGLIALHHLFAKYLAGKERMFFMAIFLYPSLLVWGSGLLKDGLLLFALGGLLLAFDKLMSGESRKTYLTVFLLCLTLLLFTKFYVLAAVAPGLLAWYSSRKMKGWKIFIPYFLAYSFFITAAFNIHRILPSWNLADMIYWKQHNFLRQADIMNPGSRIVIPELDYGVWGVLKHVPSSLLRSIIRPALTDNLSNPMVLMAALENTLLLCILLWLLLFRREKAMPSWTPLMLFALFMSCFILTLIGLITPILGALVRYKVVTFPFLTFLVLSFVRRADTKPFAA